MSGFDLLLGLVAVTAACDSKMALRSLLFSSAFFDANPRLFFRTSSQLMLASSAAIRSCLIK